MKEIGYTVYYPKDNQLARWEKDKAQSARFRHRQAEVAPGADKSIPVQLSENSVMCPQKTCTLAERLAYERRRDDDTQYSNRKHLKGNLLDLVSEENDIVQEKYPDYGAAFKEGICRGLTTGYIFSVLSDEPEKFSNRLQMISRSKEVGWCFFGREFNSLKEAVHEARERWETFYHQSKQRVEETLEKKIAKWEELSQNER